VVRNAYSQIADPLDRAAARRILGLPANAWVAGWIGRMSREKGIDVFVDAMLRVHDPIMACAIGDGPERAVEQARSDATLDDRVRWPGMVDEAGRLCRAFDAFVLSSRTEGIPIALLEAMAAETPVVVTRVGGVPDVVTEKEALIVPPEQPELLAKAIEQVRSDADQTAERVANARARLHTAFSRDRWLDEHEQIYEVASRVRRSAMGRR
jgi:glycosyltransferase involved in cell wall biosynthesis